MTASTNQTDLQRAIEQLEKWLDVFYSVREWPNKSHFELILSAAKQLQQVEEQLTNHSNAELLGETERCQFEAMKVRLKQVERERDEFERLNIDHADSFQRLNEKCEQLHSLAKQMAEALKVNMSRCECLSRIKADESEHHFDDCPYILRLEALSLAKEQGLIEVDS